MERFGAESVVGKKHDQLGKNHKLFKAKLIIILYLLFGWHIYFFLYVRPFSGNDGERRGCTWPEDQA